MTIQTRLIQPDDLPQLHQMICALATHHGDTPDINPNRLKADVLGPCPWYTVIVAQSADVTLLGYAALQARGQLQYGTRGMDMHHLFVRKSARGMGIGAALVAAAQAHCRENRCAFLTVGTHPENKDAARFYERRGFTRRDGASPRFFVRLDQPPT